MKPAVLHTFLYCKALECYLCCLSVCVCVCVCVCVWFFPIRHATTSAQIVYELNLVGHIFKFRPVAIFVSLDLEKISHIVCKNFFF